jgi:hypothetical protein
MAMDQQRRLEKLEAAAIGANEPRPIIEVRLVSRVDGELVVGDRYRMDDNGQYVLQVDSSVPRDPSSPFRAS